MGIHANKPWRTVVHIADRVGDHGGEYWMLTLDVCGHVVPRSKPRFHIYRVMTQRPLLSAPKRVRCILCLDEAVKS